jgi:GGDEF domain-containing protein
MRPPRRAGRPKRFALPADHLEEVDSDRTSERIEAFLDGPARARRTRRRHLRPDAVVRPRSVIPLDTRTDWERAVRHEDARVARYGRPASVLLVDVAALSDGTHGADDRHVRRVGAAIRTQLRETDRLARVGPTRYHALLPETDEREAAALADRVSRACREVAPQPAGAAPHVRTAVAGPVGGGSLSDAVRLAQARLDA